MPNLRIERIKKVMEYYDITNYALSKKSGIATSNIGKMLDGEQTITDKTLIKIADAFPQLNLEWLKTGNGEMFKPMSMMQENITGTALQGQGRDFKQTSYSTTFSEEIFASYTEGIKSQNKLTEKVMEQVVASMEQTSLAMAQTNKTIDMLNKTIDMLEKAYSGK